MSKYRVWCPEDGDEADGRIYEFPWLDGHEDAAKKHAEQSWCNNDYWTEIEFAVRQISLADYATDNDRVVIVKVNVEQSVEFRTEIKKELK